MIDLSRDQGVAEAEKNIEFSTMEDLETSPMSTKVSPRDKSHNLRSQVPKIGMEFDNDIDAYNFYNSYAKVIGFSVRKNHMSRNKKTGKVNRREFSCSWEGHYRKKNTPMKKREQRRSGCKAMLTIKLCGEKFVVDSFVSEHNHQLESENAYTLRSHRHIESSQKTLIQSMSRSGIKTAKIISFLGTEAGGAENLNLTESDIHNLVSRTRTQFLMKGDAQCLLKYLQEKKKANRFFFYKFRADVDNRLCGVFFSDAKARCDYNHFGDVICFDTTYKTNNYRMICAPIVGINHHGQTVLFGCGLLSDEKTASLVWLFQTFLEAMGGKHPKTIFTDQAQAISNAIIRVFPNTHHSLCLWHIDRNACANLSNVFKKFKKFASEFQKCIYFPETVKEFEERWKKLLLNFGLDNNPWLKNLYRLRTKWAQVYGRNHFSAGMTTTQRSESINSFLKKFFNGKLILREFVRQYDMALSSRRNKERLADADNRKKKPNLVTEWAIEREASQTYTRSVFLSFQDECRRSFTLKIDDCKDDGENSTYSIRRLGVQNYRSRSVSYVQATQEAKCSCKKFEFQGVLCSHILKVFLELELSALPPQYYLKRWTVKATTELVYDLSGEVIQPDLDPERTKRYSELSHCAQTLVAKAAVSKTKRDLAMSHMHLIINKLDELPDSNEEDSVEDEPTVTLLNPKNNKRRRETSNREKHPLERKRRRKRSKNPKQDKEETGMHK